MARKKLFPLFFGLVWLAAVLAGCVRPQKPISTAANGTAPIPETSAPLEEVKLEPEISLIARDYYHWYQIEDGVLMRWGVDEHYSDRQPVFENAMSVWGAMYGVVVQDKDVALWVSGSPNVVLNPDEDWTYLLSDVVSVRCGLWHGLALQADGSLWTWGHNDRGQLGNGEVAERPDNYPPQKVLNGIRKIYAATDGGLAVTSENKLMAWGSVGDIQVQTEPLQLADNVLDIQHARGAYYQLLDGDGRLYLINRDEPDRKIVVKDSKVAALGESIYYTQDGDLYLWMSSVGDGLPSVLRMDPEAKQVLPTGDGDLILNENGSLQLRRENSGTLSENSLQ